MRLFYNLHCFSLLEKQSQIEVAFGPHASSILRLLLQYWGTTSILRKDKVHYWKFSIVDLQTPKLENWKFSIFIFSILQVPDWRFQFSIFQFLKPKIENFQFSRTNLNIEVENWKSQFSPETNFNIEVYFWKVFNSREATSILNHRCG